MELGDGHWRRRRARCAAIARRLYELYGDDPWRYDDKAMAQWERMIAFDRTARYELMTEEEMEAERA